MKNTSTYSITNSYVSFVQSKQPSEEIPYENRKNLAPGLKGYYVHRLLVNTVAMWASPKYCIAVGKIMDSIDKKVHEKLDEEELEDTVENAKHLFEEEVGKMCEKQRR
ncbi:hypothetical protein TVAG_300190 [Trichomonas vaginalis G3]|uniref:KilA-N domain-containing protein n=1 Tax=Trichomonas vaginalis (strain ATCC PRA-98 / G3) TaxID=412133 RepID=A2G206_TRIV3|nr:hypothetical protein TVAGG3_0478870 [Trichomonas vaginalis G3]EAX88820.1 hypothetical protein TVAG_300190 [Trichomonas vaginalis G3]KAI5515560.1 hypothetical protein TVAGG3_0478870 [Trichomonas vaginalis G3]|eukprot:XP_001301750.1 hypothetical protein [Trichomonas vaginalis G3]